MSQISPISAAQHFAASAQFWENRAKLLQNQLDEVLAQLDELERDRTPPPEPEPVSADT